MNKFCPNCGEKIPRKAAFCPNCGYSFVSNVNDAQNQASMDRQQPSREAIHNDYQPQPYGQPYGNYAMGYYPDHRFRRWSFKVISIVVILMMIFCYVVFHMFYRHTVPNDMKGATVSGTKMLSAPAKNHNNNRQHPKTIIKDYSPVEYFYDEAFFGEFNKSETEFYESYDSENQFNYNTVNDSSNTISNTITPTQIKDEEKVTSNTQNKPSFPPTSSSKLQKSADSASNSSSNGNSKNSNSKASTSKNASSNTQSNQSNDNQGAKKAKNDVFTSTNSDSSNSDSSQASDQNKQNNLNQNSDSSNSDSSNSDSSDSSDNSDSSDSSDSSSSDSSSSDSSNSDSSDSSNSDSSDSSNSDSSDSSNSDSSSDSSNSDSGSNNSDSDSGGGSDSDQGYRPDDDHVYLDPLDEGSNNSGRTINVQESYTINAHTINVTMQMGKVKKTVTYHIDHVYRYSNNKVEFYVSGTSKYAKYHSLTFTKGANNQYEIDAVNGSHSIAQHFNNGELYISKK